MIPIPDDSFLLRFSSTIIIGSYYYKQHFHAYYENTTFIPLLDRNNIVYRLRKHLREIALQYLEIFILLDSNYMKVISAVCISNNLKTKLKISELS